MLDTLPPYLAPLGALALVGLLLWYAEGPERARLRRLRGLRR